MEGRRSTWSLEGIWNNIVRRLSVLLASEPHVQLRVIGVPSSTAYMLTYDHLLNVALPPILPNENLVPLTSEYLLVQQYPQLLLHSNLYGPIYNRHLSHQINLIPYVLFSHQFGSLSRPKVRAFYGEGLGRPCGGTFRFRGFTGLATRP